MSQLDFNSLIEQTAQNLTARMDSLLLSPEEYQQNANILWEFTKIATEQLMQEPGLEGPDPANPIPMDDGMIVQGLTLFCEGLYDALVKCATMGVTGDLKQTMIGELAMQVYAQSKQIVAATYGQEHTPEFQFSHEQQVEIIQQAAEAHLVALITEYENQHGPIIQPEAAPTPSSPSDASGSRAEQAGGMPAAAPQQAAAPMYPQGPNPHDKYAAVALLLTTLPSEQRSRILRAFDEEEKELITYYSYPQHVEQNLDLTCVKAHLKKLKETLLRANPTIKSEAYKGILALVESNPPEKLLSWVKDERPLIKRYLEAHYRRKSGQVQSPDDANSPPDPLPPRIEEILYGYLAKRLKPA
jgi:hypothetical protein